MKQKRLWMHLGHMLSPEKHKTKQNHITKLFINGKEIINSTDIANNLNKYFSSLGSSLAEKVSKSSRTFRDHLQSVSWILAEFCYNRSPQGPYTGTCTILQETINGFLCPLIVFRKM